MPNGYCWLYALFFELKLYKTEDDGVERDLEVQELRSLFTLFTWTFPRGIEPDNLEKIYAQLSMTAPHDLMESIL